MIKQNIYLKHDSEWYSLRRILGNTWAMFYVLLGARETGKSYSITKFFVKKWKEKKIPFTWMRLTEASTKKLLSNKAEKLIDPDIRRQFDLDLTVKGNNVYDHGQLMCRVLALSTFYSDKGQGYFDKDFLNDPNMYYHICLDEFMKEKNEKSSGDICYQFINQMENLVRSTKSRIRCFLVGNTLEEASDILTMFNFIPQDFGIFKLKKKRCVIDYMEPSIKYVSRRKGSVADILSDNQSNFTNKIDFDRSLVIAKTTKLMRPTGIIWFNKNTKFTIWNGNIIAEYNKEKCNNNIAMRPYLDLLFNQQLRDQIIAIFDARGFYYKNLITNKKFQKEITLLKPRKQ